MSTVERIFLLKWASLLAFLQAVSWFLMAFIAIICFYKEQYTSGDTPSTYVGIISFYIYKILINKDSNIGELYGSKMTPKTFHAFMWFYFFLSAAWAALSFLSFKAASNKDSGSRYLKFWSYCTMVISFLDFIMLCILGADYDRCSSVDIMCHNVYGIIMVVAGRGFVLWAINIGMAYLALII